MKALLWGVLVCVTLVVLALIGVMALGDAEARDAALSTLGGMGFLGGVIAYGLWLKAVS